MLLPRTVRYSLFLSVSPLRPLRHPIACFCEVVTLQYHLLRSGFLIYLINTRNSYIFYNTVSFQGRVEREIAEEVQFARFSVFRPACLLCNRQQFRLGDRAAKIMTKPLKWLDPTIATVPTDTLAKVLLF